MTIGSNQYNEADLMRMQQDAEARVREMQSRARLTVEESNSTGSFQPRNRNWSTNPGMRRSRNMQGGAMNNMNGMNGARPQSQGARPQNRRPQPEPEPEQKTPAAEPPPPPPPAEPEAEKKQGTIVGDIMDALGLDEDYLLIIGLILILVNQRADTTLILALAYLLI